MGGKPKTSTPKDMRLKSNNPLAGKHAVVGRKASAPPQQHKPVENGSKSDGNC
jgi:hypothetical protein